MKKFSIGLLLVIILSLFGVKPLMGSGYFPMHDDTQVSRVIVMGNALREGQFPVRWVSDLGYGYGYPIFNFYGPLPYYIGGSLYALGVDAVTATKMMFVIGTLLTPAFMFIALSSFVGIIPAVLASVLYMYAPYHAVQIYVRGAVGEYWAYAWFPLLVYGLWGLKHSASQRYVLVGGVGLAGVILSHTITGFIVMCGLGVYTSVFLISVLYRKKSFRELLPYIRLLGLGFGASAFFWIPAFFEKQFTSVEGMMWDTTDFRDHFVCFPQLWNSMWGFGGSASGCIDGVSFKLGKVHILGALLGFGMFLLTKKRELRGIFLSGIGVLLVSVCMTTEFSRRVWEVIPYASYIQYPWRFLSFAAFGTAVCSIGILLVRNPFLRVCIAACGIVLVVAVNGKVFVPQFVYEKSPSEFENMNDLRFRVSKISDEYLPPQIPRPVNENEVVHGTIVSGQDIRVESEFESSTYGKYPIEARKQTEIMLKKAYFPGFVYLVNGKRQVPVIMDGLPHLTVPEGRSVVEVFFRDTPVRSFANIVSVLTLLIVLIRYGKKTVC